MRSFVTVKHTSALVFCALYVCISIGCGPSGVSTFTANGTDDLLTVNDLPSNQVMILLANDGGNAIVIDEATDGLYGTVSINAGSGSINYQPKSINVNFHYADWFQYRIQTSSGSFAHAKGVIRFTDFESDQYEPDDFQELARYIQLSVGQTVTETHTSDMTNAVGVASFDVGYQGTGAFLGGDEDWFIVDVETAAAGMQRFLKIETVLPSVTLIADHDILMIRAMDQFGFLANDINGVAAINYRGGSPSNDNNLSTSDSTLFDRALSSGRYYICVNNNTNTRGVYQINFSLHDEPSPLMAPTAVGVLSEHKEPLSAE